MRGKNDERRSCEFDLIVPENDCAAFTYRVFQNDLAILFLEPELEEEKIYFVASSKKASECVLARQNIVSGEQNLLHVNDKVV